MAYTIDKYNGTTVAVVEDGTIDSTLDIKLIGKNYAGYGESQNENFVWLLENFAGASAPPRPVSGQLWYNTTTKKLNFYDSGTAKWKTAGGSEASPSQPANLSEGDFWFDTANKQLYVYDGSQFVLVGPQGIAGLGTTQMKSLKVTDDQAPANEHGVIAGYVDGEAMFVLSSDPTYTLSAASQTELGGGSAFGIIKPGITLVNTNNSDGITDAGLGRIFWGTVSAAKGLISGTTLLTADDFIQKSIDGITSFTGLVKFVDAGYTLGNNDDLLVEVNNNDVVFERKTSNEGLTFKLNDTLQPLNVTRFKMLSSTQSQTLGGLAAPALIGDTSGNTNLGHPSALFNRVYAAEFKGTADKADELKVGASYRTAAVDTAGTGTANTIAVRDSAGRLSAAAFLGNATSATSATTATNSDNLKVGSNYRTASVDVANTGSANTVVCRDGSGNVNAFLFQGTATSALFADLAEKYLADQEYEVGTVVVVGGDAEVTACQSGDRAFGAVSANPAFMMNQGLEGGTYIALKGRVPVKVLGPVRKGDRLMAASNGCATAAHIAMKNTAVRASNFPDTFAIALENSDDTGVKLVEAIIL